MKRAAISKIAFALLFLATYAHALSTEIGSMYAEEGRVALFSIVSIPSFGPLTAHRIDLSVPDEDLGGHYSLTSVVYARKYFALKSFFLELPGYEDPLETNPISAGLSALELRYPFASGGISAGYFTTHYPDLSGEVDGVSGKLRDFELSGIYGSADFADAGIFGLAGSITGTVAVSKLEAGEFDGHFGMAGLKWKTYGIAGGYFQGDCSLADNIVFNLFSGKIFSAEGDAALGAFGAWGYTEFMRGKVSFSVLSFLGLVWSWDTDLEYRERNWTVADSHEYVWNGAIDWDPAGLVVLYPKLTLNLDPSLSIRIARLLPMTWGWNFYEGERDVTDDTSEDSAWGATPNLSLETLLLSGLTVSVKATFR